MIFGSTSRNVHLLSILVMVSTIVGLFLPLSFTWYNLVITFVSFYVLNILGVWMTLHRYYSHKSFEFRNKYLKYFFSILAMLAGRGSIISWVYIHRQHHSYSDTEKDPHSPKVLGYKLFGFGHYKQMEREQFKVFLVKDILNDKQLLVHKYYMLFILLFVMLLSLISIDLLYFAYIVPMFLVQLSQNNFNFFGHKLGYRNFATPDNSRNNPYLFPIILGEAWHNNHHAKAKEVSTKVKPYEFDPLVSVIKLIS